MVVAAILFVWQPTEQRDDASRDTPRGESSHPRVPRGAPSDVVRHEHDRGSAAAAPVATVPDCILTVLNDLGAAVANAHVALFRGEDLLATGRTVADGSVRLPGSSEPASVAIFPIAAGPFVQDVHEPSGEVRVRLPEGGIVSGRVEIDGAAPGQAVNVAVWLHDLSKIPAIWPASVERAIIETFLPGPAYQRQVTDATGRFRFAGLPRETALSIHAWVSPRWTMEGGHHGGLVIKAPTAGIVLNLSPCPGVAGRVVANGTRLPVPRAWVSGRVSYREASEGHFSTAADEHGNFFLAFPTPPDGVGTPSGASVRVSTEAYAGMKTHEVSAERMVSGGNLGDLDLSPTRLVAYRVEDAGGSPIPGGFVRYDDEQCRIQSVADEVGRGTIELPLANASVTAAAFGFGHTTLEARESLADELRFVLPRACVLEVRVRSQEGGKAAPDAVEVEVEAESRAPLFNGDPSSWWEWRRSETVTQPGWVQGEIHRFLFNAPEVAMSSIRPGMPVRVTARDRFGQLRVAQTVTLENEERRTLELRLPTGSRFVKGRVTNVDGTPAYWWQVKLIPITRNDEHSLSRTTARDGSFVFDDVLAERALLAVDGTAWIREVTIRPEGIDVAVRLEEHHSAEVRVVDINESLVDNVEVLIRSGSFLQRETTDGGVASIEPVPAGEVLIEARFGNLLLKATARVPGPTTTLTLPPWGTLNLDFTRSDVTASKFRLEPIDGADPLVREFSGSQMHIDGIRPGRYRAWVEGWRDEAQTEAITVEGPEVMVMQGQSTSCKFGE